jgi:hypothetical protein
MSAGAGFGSGFLAGAGGLGRSISNGKQIGPVVPLMSPTGTGDARGQGILRRLSLGAGAARVGPLSEYADQVLISFVSMRSQTSRLLR